MKRVIKIILILILIIGLIFGVKKIFIKNNKETNTVVTEIENKYSNYTVVSSPGIEMFAYDSNVYWWNESLSTIKVYRFEANNDEYAKLVIDNKELNYIWRTAQNSSNSDYEEIFIIYETNYYYIVGSREKVNNNSYSSTLYTIFNKDGTFFKEVPTSRTVNKAIKVKVNSGYAYALVNNVPSITGPSSTNVGYVTGWSDYPHHKMIDNVTLNRRYLYYLAYSYSDRKLKLYEINLMSGGGISTVGNLSLTNGTYSFDL